MTDPEGQPPRRRFDPLVGVLLGVAAGITVVTLHHARVGLYVVAVALGAGAVLRLVLRPRAAASLVVRARHLDAILLAGLAVAVAVLAAVTPLKAAP